jgi:hypothetical protein
MNNKIFNQIENVNLSFTIDDLMERISDRYRWPRHYLKHVGGWNYDNVPSIKAILQNDEEFFDFYLDDGYVDANKVHDMYNNGYTLVLSRVQYLFNDISQITDILMNEYGNATANIYVGKGTSAVSFKDHTHPYSVLVKNVQGKSVWVLNNEEFIMNDQHALFFGPNVTHRVDRIIEPKLSITFNIVSMAK